MVRLRTLNELAHLRETKFGQPYPRHGLSLLWWFADEYVEIDDDGNMTSQYNPEDGDFGFHPFHNNEKLLPDTDLPYYEVGNLARDFADDLPPRVTRNYDDEVQESNADRIVVSVNSDWEGQWFDRVYVTHHLGEHGGFDEDETYRISQGLVELIQDLEWPDFIEQVKVKQRRNRRRRR